MRRVSWRGKACDQIRRCCRDGTGRMWRRFIHRLELLPEGCGRRNDMGRPSHYQRAEYTEVTSARAAGSGCI